MNVQTKILMGSLSMVMALPAFAISDAAKIGANAGAMSYCREQVVSANQRMKYATLATRSLQEFEKLEGDEKTKALVMKRAADNGEYLGKPLTNKRCKKIRNSLFVLYGMD